MNILYIDNCDNGRELYDLVLSNSGENQVDLAGNGVEGLMKVLENPQRYQAIVTDFEMPVMNGLVFLEHLAKLDTSYVGNPFKMLISSSTDPSLSAKASKLGAEFMTRPKSVEGILTGFYALFCDFQQNQSGLYVPERLEDRVQLQL
ncbi:MAG: response regulator [Candidatus Woesearchaeota archaeon]